ncbi:MAG: hypothetical protein HPY62_04930 [Bacteroidales bacterium]|nr:hypothetical protein [Bacteroidales bacterium]
MKRFDLYYLFLLIILFYEAGLSGMPDNDCQKENLSFFRQDVTEKQLLFNGVVWRNLYPHVRGNQFLFTNDFIKGSVTIEGKRFPDLRLKYDIYNDQVLAINEKNIMIQLNREMVDSFSLDYNSRMYRFGKVENDSTESPRGFVNVLCDGPVSLVVKYRKEILLHAVENTYDLFSQIQKVYVRKEGVYHPVTFRRDLFKVFGDSKKEVKNYLRSKKIRISVKDPDTIVPVIQYYNNLISAR